MYLSPFSFRSIYSSRLSRQCSNCAEQSTEMKKEDAIPVQSKFQCHSRHLPNKVRSTNFRRIKFLSLSIIRILEKASSAPRKNDPNEIKLSMSFWCSWTETIPNEHYHNVFKQKLVILIIVMNLRQRARFCCSEPEIEIFINSTLKQFACMLKQIL